MHNCLRVCSLFFWTSGVDDLLWPELRYPLEVCVRRSSISACWSWPNGELRERLCWRRKSRMASHWRLTVYAFVFVHKETEINELHGQFPFSLTPCVEKAPCAIFFSVDFAPDSLIASVSRAIKPRWAKFHFFWCSDLSARAFTHVAKKHTWRTHTYVRSGPHKHRFIDEAKHTHLIIFSVQLLFFLPHMIHLILISTFTF